MISNVRKEPALFVVVLLIAAWMWSGYTEPRFTTAARPTERPYEPPPPVRVVLAPAAGEAAYPTRDLFREPTEAAPLPPRPLPFPDLEPLPVVAPPLHPGPEAGAFHLLRVAAGPVEPHAFPADAAAEGAAAEGGDEGLGDEGAPAAPPAPSVSTPGAAPAAGGPQGPGAAIPPEVLAQRYDRVWRENDIRPFYGFVLNTDKLELVGRAILPVLRMDVVSPTTGKVISKALEIRDAQKLELADNLENRIALRKLGITPGPAGELERIAFLRDLLRDAREQPWVFQEAEAQAQQLVAVTSGAEVGYRWLVRVLRAQGDLSREWALYQGLEGSIANSPFRWREQGRLEALLTLWDDAEAHLRKGVELAPTDARSLGALAQFLLDRGRAAAAQPFALRAERAVNTVTPDEDRTPIIHTVASVYLALGEVEAAQRAADRFGSGASTVERSYVLGCIAYAAGELGEAAAQFERVANDDAGRLDAVLGLGCTRARQGAWDEAYGLLVRARDEAPALRAQAWAGLAFLFERTGNDDRVRSALAAAERADPRDAYVLYLLGRRQRLDGELDACLETLRRALAERDDLTCAFAETTRALLARAAEEGEGGAEYVAQAVRYATRLVELDAARGDFVPFIALKGYVLALVGDVNAAREAFTRAAERGSDFADLGLALLDYRTKRTLQARDRLVAIQQDPVRATATRDFARATVALIDDHATKEQVRDTFERDLLGGFWKTTGSVRVQEPLRGQLRLTGDSTRTGGAATIARQPLAGGDFLSVAVDVEVQGDVAPVQFAGLEVATVAQSGQRFLVEVGFRRQSTGQLRPSLVLEDGASRTGDEGRVVLDLSSAVGAVEPHEPQRLEVAVVPGSGDGPAANRFGLVVRWNGIEVYRADSLRRLSRTTRTDLVTALKVEGRGLDVVFDDYRLERRRSS
ncbi:MAG: hypothetical protein IPM29_19420 [Planctomycetes bacterium]|nr:hypothetical protein [Planctomycetota bacterium]